jgi:hypothetical protein
MSSPTHVHFSRWLLFGVFLGLVFSERPIESAYWLLVLIVLL